MNLVVITPVGPGHEKIVSRAVKSVSAARGVSMGGFGLVKHEIVMDLKGEMGRSTARNVGIDQNPKADWFFFLDADDMMRDNALGMNDFGAPATFGAVSLNGRIVRENVWPCGWREVAVHGATGTLSMGFYCSADVARSLRFRTDMDAGEDFDFYLRLSSFAKQKEPLADIGRDTPSAVGPRGYTSLDWVGVCNKIIVEAVKREPKKYDLGSYAVLAKAARSKRQPYEIPGSVS